MPVTPLSGPNLIDATAFIWSRWVMDGSSQPGPFRNGADYYVAWGATPPKGTIRKSVDNGLTWAIVYQNLAADDFFVVQGAAPNLLAVVYNINTGLGTFNWVVAQFDMNTDTLTVLDATLVTPEEIRFADYCPARNEFIVWFTTPPPGPTFQMRRYLGGAWQPDELIAAGAFGVATSHTDAAGRTHFVRYGGVNTWYHQINTAGVLLPTVGPIATYGIAVAPSWLWFGRPEVFGNNIILPYSRQSGGIGFGDHVPAALIGTPIAAPVFTSTDLSSNQIGGEVNVQVVAEAARVRFWWGETIQMPGFVPICKLVTMTWDGAAFGPREVAQDQDTSPSFPGVLPQIFYNLSPPLWLGGDSYALHVTMLWPPPGVGFNWGSQFFWLFGPAPAPPAVGIIPTAGSRRMVILVPNKFDQCLYEDTRSARGLEVKRPCCFPLIYRNVMEVRVPEKFRAFLKTAAIPTPLPVDGDVEVLNFEVPEGYDGMIAGVFHGYTGPGFLEGNGDLEWRLIVNRTYAIHMGRILVSLGRRNQPFLVDGGIGIRSGTNIRYIVSAPNLSGGILPVNSRIFAGVEGLFYARS